MIEYTFNSLHEECNQIKLKLNYDLFPETINFIEIYQEENFSDYELATALVQCDKTVDMPCVLFDFIVKLYKNAIAKGDSNAMNDLGALYYDGRGCKQDFKKAVFYYDMASKYGNRQAQENLGYCYYYGRDVEKDYEKAFHYFAMGAFAGRLISLYKIGDMYQNGYYVKKDPTEAFAIYERCFEMMKDEDVSIVAGPVFLRIGKAFLDGNGTEMNAKMALICFQKAEIYLYDMVVKGNFMYKKSLYEASVGQSKAREILAEELAKLK